MNAQGILTRIEKDAREAAASTLRDAQRRAQELRAQSDEKIARARAEAQDMAQREAVALDDRMQRMAKLDARKELLAAKRTVLDEAFAKALKKMAAMPDQDARAFGMQMMISSASGNETVVADSESAWCDARFLEAANARLKELGKQGALVLSVETRNLGGGFVLERGGMEINCSYQAALEGRRMDIEAEIAATLFADEA